MQEIGPNSNKYLQTNGPTEHLTPSNFCFFISVETSASAVYICFQNHLYKTRKLFNLRLMDKFLFSQ